MNKTKPSTILFITTILAVVLAVVVVVIVGLLFISVSQGQQTSTAQGTILTRTYPYPWYQFCLPNCGYHYSVLLSNGTTIHYLDTCQWSIGQQLNFTYWTKAGWMNDIEICD